MNRQSSLISLLLLLSSGQMLQTFADSTDALYIPGTVTSPDPAQDVSNQIMQVALLTLIPFVVAFSFIFFVFYRQRREASFREKEAQLKRQIAEVEMKALRAQMNPHFLFNCLNSIHRYMVANQTSEAGGYLIKFSNLIRLVLENSIHREIPLKKDLEALELYIDMERMRMNGSFEYAISVAPGIDGESVSVPPLIMQPFVENSIWHGLNNKPGNGFLNIFISQEGDMLKLTIEDNGSQSDKPANPLIKKGRSLGMMLTQERLDILNAVKNTKAYYSISDKSDKGTYAGKKVELYLPLEAE